MGPYPNATAVFDIDAIGLTNLVNQLNHGLDPGGNAIGAPTRFTIGVGVNPAALDPAQEMDATEMKDHLADAIARLPHLGARGDAARRACTHAGFQRITCAAPKSRLPAARLSVATRSGQGF